MTHHDLTDGTFSRIGNDDLVIQLDLSIDLPGKEWLLKVNFFQVARKKCY